MLSSENEQQLEETTSAVETQLEADVQAEKKGPKKGLIIGIVAAVVAVVAVLAVLFFTGILMPAKFMLAKAVNNGKDDFVAEYKVGYDAIEKAYADVNGDMNMGVKVTLGDQTKSLLNTYGSALGLDLSWIDNANVNMGLDVQDEQLGIKMAGSLNDVEITTAEMVLDASSEMAYVSLPEVLKDQAVAVDAELEGEAFADMLKNYTETITNYTDKYPTPQEMDKILSKYTDVLINDCKDAKITKSKEELTAADVTAKYTKLTLVLDKKLANQLTVDMIDTVQSDEDLKEMYRTIMETQFESGAFDDTYASFDEFWDELVGALDDAKIDAQEELNSIADDPSLNEEIGNIYVYVDGSCRAKGVCIEDTDDEFKAEFYAPVNGKNAGLVIRVESLGEEEFILQGQGSEEGGMFNGSYDMTVEGEEICTIAVKDLDLAAYKDRNFKGTFVVSLSSTVTSMISDPSLATFALADYAITFDTQDLSGTMKFDVLAGDESLVAMDITYAMEDVEDMTIPAKTIDIESLSDEDSFNLVKSLDLSSVVGNLEKAGVPQAYYQKLKDFSDALESGDEMEIAYALGALMGEDTSSYGYEEDAVGDDEMAYLASLSYDEFKQLYLLYYDDGASDDEIKQYYDMIQMYYGQ